jgi:hypothetical protein
MVVLALVLSTGLHWAALQTVAWTAMFASNLQSDSLVQAFSKTFDGQHPCCLCKAIAAAKKSGKKSAALAPALKMEYTFAAGKISLFPPTPPALCSRNDILAETLAAKPPHPPPRKPTV